MSQASPTFLHIDLSNQKSEVVSYEELIPRVGGLGWALSLFEKFYNQDAGEEGLPIIFALGPLSAVFPGVSRVVAVFRSPQTLGLATSLGGGQLARFLRFAGYQGLVITGKASSPTFVGVDDGQIDFKDSSHLKGLPTPKVFERIHLMEGAPSKRSVVATGPATEAGFGFSPLYIDEFFSFARDGLGSAFFAKNLKGLAVSGSKSEDIANPRRYGEVFRELIKRSSGFKELSAFGTLKNIAVEKKISGVPFKNLAEVGLPTDELLPKSFQDEMPDKKISSASCPVGDVRVFKWEKRYVPYDFESVVSLGPLLGLVEPSSVARLIVKAYDLGFDPTSLGVILAYLTEEEKLNFGDLDSYETLIDALYFARENWSKDLKQGAPQKDNSLTLGGIEFLPYFNGYASLASQILRLGATTEENRGYILDLDLLEGEVNVDQAVSLMVSAEEKKTLSELLVGNGHLASVFEDPAVSFAALDALGYSFKHEFLVKEAAEVFRQKLSLQKLLGFNPLSVRIPRRFFEVPSPQGFLKEEKLKGIVEVYKNEVFETAG
ncbi:hypothetical protein GTO10_02300 [Candidatus Saccharibacteria bacterium]|nr:hypothetical protein [Candidatus Saccharibacteria bacterium]